MRRLSTFIAVLGQGPTVIPVQIGPTRRSTKAVDKGTWRGARQSARSACTASTRAARSAGVKDAKTADMTTTAAAASKGSGPGS